MRKNKFLILKIFRKNAIGKIKCSTFKFQTYDSGYIKLSNSAWNKTQKDCKFG